MPGDGTKNLSEKRTNVMNAQEGNSNKRHMESTITEIKSEGADQLYLDLMKQCLTRFIFPESYRQIRGRPSRRDHPVAWAVYPMLTPALDKLKRLAG